MATQFTPFDDSQQIVYIPTTSATGGTNTNEIDPFRQGVEIKTSRQLYSGNQPKFWSGNLDHEIDDTTPFGQARSFVEYEDSLIWEEFPEFSPVAYVELGINYPLPVVFNEGPQAEEEAYVEPITIPYRRPSTEGPFFAHRVWGSVEDGNNLDNVFGKTSISEQFIQYFETTDIRPFLDMGGQYWESSTDGLVVDGYTWGQEVTSTPFRDNSIETIPRSLSAAPTDMLDLLITMKMNLDEDFRPNDTKSANANTFTYGRDASKYGTDSITYLGTTLGS